MRSLRDVMAAAAAAALGLTAAGCGNWSNDDVAFVRALPAAEHLRVTVPASAAAAAAAAVAGRATVACAPPGASPEWAWAKPTSDGLNAVVQFLVGLIDAVRHVEPTTRGEGRRTWGPFADANHPGKVILIRMARTGDGDPPTFTFELLGGDAGGELATLIEATLTGVTAAAGSGTLTLHFGAFRQQGMDDHPDTDPAGDVTIGYDRTRDPRTVAVAIANPTTGERVTYEYRGYASGDGWFQYVFTNASQQTYAVAASFDPAGEGKGDVKVVWDPTQPNAWYAFSECWDAAGCVTHVDDPYAGSWWAPDGISKLCPGGVCPSGACPTFPF